MIKSITVTNYRGEAITIDLYDPEKSGFAVREVTGIGPGVAEINLSDISAGDGSLYNSARIKKRNIVLSLIYVGVSIESVRQMSYKYFPLKKQVTLVFETENRKAEIRGYVESNEPNIFSKSEGSDISILCPDPFFYAYGEDGNKIVYFSGVEPMFEFPFSNESTRSSLLEMSSIKKDKIKSFVYEGDSDTDVTITIHAFGDARGITIWDTNTRAYMKINASMIDGDDIIITTKIGNKTIIQRRNAIDTNILNLLDRGANWFRIYKGTNTFSYDADVGVNNLEFKMEYKLRYEGV